MPYDVSPGQKTTHLQRVSGWQTWAGLLVALYVGIGLIGWQRTLIPDEIRPLLLAAAPLSEQIAVARLDLVQTPLSYLLWRGWLDLFGHTDQAAKTLALLLNVSTLILFTALAHKVTPYWRLTAFLFAVPYLRIGSALNLARMYGLLVLLMVIALLLWEQWRQQPSSRKLAVWTLVMILMLYTHGSALLVLPVFVLMNWVYGPRRWGFIVAASLAGLALLPWIAYVLPVYQTRGLTENIRALSPHPTRALAELPFFFLAGEDPGGAAPVPPLHAPSLRLGLPLAAVLLHGVLGFFAWPKICQAWRLARQGQTPTLWLWSAVLLCGVPPLTLYAVSLAAAPVIHARYMLVGLPGYALFLGFVVHYAGGAGKVLLRGIILPWVVLSIVLTVAQAHGQSPLHHATDVVARELRDTDLILCERHMPLGWQVYWEWTRRLGRTEPLTVLWSPITPEWLTSTLPAQRLEQLDLTGVARIWLFSLGPLLQKQLLEFLRAQGFTLSEQYGSRLAPLLVLVHATAPLSPAR
jgi:hypothetical protein